MNPTPLKKKGNSDYRQVLSESRDLLAQLRYLVSCVDSLSVVEILHDDLLGEFVTAHALDIRSGFPEHGGEVVIQLECDRVHLR